MTIYAAQIVNDIITIYGEGKVHTVPTSHVNYHEILDKVKEGSYKEALALANVSESLKEYSSGKVLVEDNLILYEGEELHTALTTRMLSMMREGFNIDPMLKFLENLMENPSKQSRDELNLFLEGNSLPITEDGHFIAYRGVTKDYKDSYSRKYDQSIGTVNEMDRAKVDDNRKNTCSDGLHFASLDYASTFSQRTMVVKINPRDVVSIPYDYNNQKGRCCRYEVIDELPRDDNGAYQEYTDKSVVRGDTRLNHLNQQRDSKGRFV